jgi:hypothetical protein
MLLHKLFQISQLTLTDNENIDHYTVTEMSDSESSAPSKTSSEESQESDSRPPQAKKHKISQSSASGTEQFSIKNYIGYSHIVFRFQ